MDQPKPDQRKEKAVRVKIQGNWEAAIDKALAKPKPADGWPAPPDRQTRKRKPKAN